MLRTLPSLALAALAVLATRPALAQPFEDIGPALGLPASAMIPTGDGLVAAASFGDLDGDGDLDMVRSGAVGGVRLYRRDGPKFVWDSAAFSAVGNTNHQGNTLFDMDGDGDLDVLVLVNGKSFLFENQGGQFTDVTATHLPTSSGWAASAVAGDLDGDGDLDLVIVRYLERLEFPLHRPCYSLVLENDGGGRFIDRTRTSGFGLVRGASFAAALVDLDGDLDLDVVLVNDFAMFTRGPSAAYGQSLWMNDGHFVFREVSKDVGFVAPVYGMGIGIADADQDGRLDMVISNIGEPAALTRQADGTFVGALAALGIGLRFERDQHIVTWNVGWEDLDGDGYLDLVLAAGHLGAASFIANADQQYSVVMRGTSRGTLAMVPKASAFSDNDHAARGLGFEDLDFDGVPDIVLAHINGRVGVYKNVGVVHRPLTLTLQPRYTGAGAAGARVVGVACGVTRTRTVVGGTRYGSSDRGVVRIAWPSPCDQPDKLASVDVRWPSGFVERVATTTGASLVLEEPSWLSIGDDAIDVDLSKHVGDITSVALAGDGLVLGALADDRERGWHASWELAEGRSEGSLDVIVDGVTWGAHPRLRKATSVPVFIDPSTPIVGRELRVVAPPRALVSWDGEVASVPESGELVLQVGLDVGPKTLEARVDLTTTKRELVVAPRFDAANSELTVRDLHVRTLAMSGVKLRLRMHLLDANGAGAAITTNDLAVRVDGVVHRDYETVQEGEWWSVRIAQETLRDGAKLELMVGDQLPFLPQVVAHIDSNDELGRLVDPLLSGCWLSESRLWANGLDVGTVYGSFVDKGGTRIPLLDVAPTWTAVNAGIVRGTPASSGATGFTATVRAGAVAGSVTPLLPGQPVPFSCPVRAGPTPTIGPAVSADATMIGSARPQVNVQTIWRITPLGADGRALGSAAHLEVEADGANVVGVDYVGYGRFEANIVPTRAPLVTLHIYDGDALLSELDVAVADADPVAEPAPEEAPEVTPEESPETAPEVGPEAAPEEGPEAAPEEGPEPTTEPMPDADPADTSVTQDDTRDTEDALSVPDTSAADTTVVGGDALTPEPDIDGPAADADSPRDAGAELAEGAVERSPARDDGCAGGPDGSLALALIALALSRAQPSLAMRRAR